MFSVGEIGLRTSSADARLVTVGHMNAFLLGRLLPAETEPDPTEEPTGGTIGEGVEQAVEVTFDIVGIAVTTAVGAVLGLLAAMVLIVIVQMIGRRHPILEPALDPPRRPFQLLMILVGAWVAFVIRTDFTDKPEPGWRNPIFHIGLILVILAGTWFLARIVVGFEAAVVKHVERSATKRAKRIQTQFQIVRRVLVAIVWTMGIAGVLITFPTARAAGASIFASAGIFSVIAGLAAQSTLGNVFAGLQVAFSDSLRVDDIVIINGEYCVVEEITLTYVVVRVWDGRRLIVPSSKLTTESFENWTRRDSELMGKLYFDLDWQVPLDAMRSEMMRCVEGTDLWDGRIALLQVDSAENGRVRVAILVSAADSPTLTDLRYYVREHMVKWIQSSVPKALPYSRTLYATIDDLETAIAEYPDPAEFVTIENDPAPAKPRAKQKSVDMEQTVVLPIDYLPFRRSLSKRTPPEPIEEELTASPSTAEGLSMTGTSTGHESSLYSGSPEAEARAKDFAGPGEDVIAERERRAAQRNAVGEDDETAEWDDEDSPSNSGETGTENEENK